MSPSPCLTTLRRLSAPTAKCGNSKHCSSCFINTHMFSKSAQNQAYMAPAALSYTHTHTTRACCKSTVLGGLLWISCPASPQHTRGPCSSEHCLSSASAPLCPHYSGSTGQQVLGKEQGLSFQLLWVLGSPGPRVTLSKPQVPESLGRGHFYSLAYLGVRVALGLMTSQRAPFLQSCALYTVNAH